MVYFIKYLQNKTVDLILLDYAMPEEDGPAVFEKLLVLYDTHISHFCKSFFYFFIIFS